MAGVFVVTILGCAIASVFAIIEFLVGTRQSAKVYLILNIKANDIETGVLLASQKEL